MELTCCLDPSGYAWSEAVGAILILESIGAGLEPRSIGTNVVLGSVGPVWCSVGQHGACCLHPQGQAWILSHGLPVGASWSLDSLEEAGAWVYGKVGCSLHSSSPHAKGVSLHTSLHRLGERVMQVV